MADLAQTLKLLVQEIQIELEEPEVDLCCFLQVTPQSQLELEESDVSEVGLFVWLVVKVVKLCAQLEVEADLLAQTLKLLAQEIQIELCCFLQITPQSQLELEE